MATADQIYVDPSALTRLYITQAGSREMSAWRKRHPQPLPVTHFGHAEIINAISLGRFRNSLTESQADSALECLAEDFALGHLKRVDLLWRAALKRAAELSQLHSPKLGTRSLDVLHVSCALELGLRYFFTFDEKQSALAKAVGLKALQP